MHRPQSLVIVVVFAALLAAGGAFTQDAPDEPRAPEAPEAPRAAEAPDAPEPPPAAEKPDAPQAAEAPEAPQAAEAPEAPEPPPAAEEPEQAEQAEAAAAPSMAFETTVPFEPVKKTTLDGRAGAIELRSVEFTISQTKGGVLGSSDTDLKATISILVECATDADKKAKFDLTVHFLDADGGVIDRTSAGFGLKAGSKLFETKHTTLKYVVPLIETVKLSAVAKK